MSDAKIENKQPTNRIKSILNRRFIAILFVVFVIFISIYCLVKTDHQEESDNSHQSKRIDKSGHNENNNDRKIDTANFSNLFDQVKPESLWLERAQNQLKEQQRQTDELKQTVNQIKTESEDMASNPQYKALTEQNELLKKSLEEKQHPVSSALEGGNSYQGNVFPPSGGANPSDMPGVDNIEAIGIDNDVLDLMPVYDRHFQNKHKKTPETFVPSGTFVEAIMLGAADASAGVNSQANPSPMLFRIVAKGTLPNHQKSHLKDCVVTAAVVGDISSERGQIRLERLSCTFPNGEVVEQPVEGTIFGMDAKNGVRGNPVWRESALLARAAIAGTLSGIGSGVSQSYTTNSISPLGTTQTIPGGDVFKYGAAQGVSHAMEKLADYNIRRAEQYHPVIQLAAGQPVDVVFLKGFYLDGHQHDSSQDQESEQGKENSSELFPPASSAATHANSEAASLTLSEHDIEKIKQHEQAMGLIPQSGDAS